MSTLELKGGLIEVIAKIDDDEALSKLLKVALGLVKDDKAFEISKIWQKEIDKREADLENGRSIGRPLTDVLTKYKK